MRLTALPFSSSLFVSRYLTMTLYMPYRDWETEHQQEIDEERYGHDTPTEEEIDQMFADYDNCIAKDLEDDRGMIGD